MITVKCFVVSENQLAIDSAIVMVNMCYWVDHFPSNLNTFFRPKSVGNFFNKYIYLLVISQGYIQKTII